MVKKEMRNIKTSLLLLRLKTTNQIYFIFVARKTILLWKLNNSAISCLVLGGSEFLQRGAYLKTDLRIFSDVCRNRLHIYQKFGIKGNSNEDLVDPIF